METLIIDIETGPLPVDQIEIPPFEPPANIKDPAKIAEREEAYRRKFIEDAALDALTGQVLAIGLMRPGKEPEMLADDEGPLLVEFVHRLEILNWPVLVGFNIALFDLPFLFRRCWAQRIWVPVHRYRRGRYWNDDNVVDLREVWQLGDRQARGSLDAIAKLLRVGQKTGDGKDFGKLLAENPEAAKEYLFNDLRLTDAIYRKLMWL